MAGFTDVMIGNWGDDVITVPLELVARGAKRVDTSGSLWHKIMAKTGQPEHLV